MQKAIDKEKTLEERRSYGQFSTPFSLAKEMASYALSLLKSKDIAFLEPCIGSGVFYSALLDAIDKDVSVCAAGIEIDKDYYACARKLWQDTGIELINGDFTRMVPEHSCSLVLTNPPYVRHHCLSKDDKARLQNCVKKETGLALSGLAGLYCHFILLAHKWLAKGAVCGWLVPAEFMDVNYGSTLKSYLLNSVRLLRIHRYTPEASMFSDALVSSCVVWFKNETDESDYEVEFSLGGTHDAPQDARMVKKTALCEERKWTRFPERSIRCEAGSPGTPGTALGDFFEIKRGIATGDNSFFIMSRDKVKELGIDMSLVKPVLPSPRHLKTDFVGSDSCGLPQIEQQYFLLDCTLTEHELEERYPSAWSYLQSGIGKTSNKYLCRSRRKWYLQEHREAACFLCSYMGRSKGGSLPVRFILNLSKAVATNSYLMLYPRENLRKAISANPGALYKIWNALKGINGCDLEAEGRVYGGGLKKIEPRELARVPCCDLMHICAV